jgi:hypothetical protein
MPQISDFASNNAWKWPQVWSNRLLTLNTKLKQKQKTHPPAHLPGDVRATIL